MNAIALQSITPRSLVEERNMRPPTIGRIRPGIKVLKASARSNERAAKIYSEMCDAGESFENIGKAIEAKCNLRDALVPKNVPYFTCRPSDFGNGAVANEILKLYGEDRGDGMKLYRFPVLFAFNDWMHNFPNQMAAWGTTGRKFFSEYGTDGVRYCKTYEKPTVDRQAQRVRRNFGGRITIFRQDEAIPDGRCDPEQCPQYQARQCNLTATLIFAIPDIKGLGLVELPTNSIYVLQKAYSAMQTVLLARGRLTGTRFWLSKREFDITRINEEGEPTRQKQMLTVLDADIDIGALLDAADEPVPALDASHDALALIGGGVEDTSSTTTSSDEGVATAHVTESLEDKRNRLGDLLQRLGISTDALKKDFTLYARQSYGPKWTDRPADVDGMNEVLVAALANPNAFHGKLRQACFDVLND